MEGTEEETTIWRGFKLSKGGNKTKSQKNYLFKKIDCNFDLRRNLYIFIIYCGRLIDLSLKKTSFK